MIRIISIQMQTHKDKSNTELILTEQKKWDYPLSCFAASIQMCLKFPFWSITSSAGEGQERSFYSLRSSISWLNFHCGAIVSPGLQEGVDTGHHTPEGSTFFAAFGGASISSNTRA